MQDGTKMNQHVLKSSRTLSPSSWSQYALVGSVAAACYLNGLSGEFVHDDVPAIVFNKDVMASSKRLFTVFRNDFWGTPMTDSRSHKSYRPLTTLTFRVNYLMVGLEPFWFHGTNVFLHCLVTILFTKVCVKVAKMTNPFAILAGLMFAVHPIHTEAVTGIVGRVDVLACVWFLISILTYHNPSKDDKLWISLLSGGLSLLAKETGISVFLVNVFYDIYQEWYIKRASDVRLTRERRTYIQRTLTVLLTFSVLIILRQVLLRGSLPKFTRGDNPAAFHPSFQVRLLTFCYIASFNFWLLLCPCNLSHDWQMGSIPLITSFQDPRNILTLLIFTLILLVFCKTFHFSKSSKKAFHAPSNSLALGLIILLIPFLPACNLLSTAGFVLAERVLYIPSMGFILLVVQGMSNIWTVLEKQRQTLISMMLFLLIVHGFQCLARNNDWLSRESLLTAGVRALPHNAKMHYNFANFLRDSGRVDLAKAHYDTAIKLWPTYASAYNNLGTLIKNNEKAEKHFLMAIRFNQRHLNAHYNLGQLYRKQNRTKKAEKMLQKCINLSPNFILGYVELIKLHELANNTNVGSLFKIIVRQSKKAEYSMLYAKYLRKKGNHYLAIKYYNNALFDCNCKLEAFIGSATILRSLGSHARLLQLITRYHAMQRLKRGDVGIQPNIYLQRWFLSYELEKHALDYNPGHWATDEHANEWFNEDKLQQSSRLFQNQRCATTVIENVTIATNNCQD